MRNRYRIFACLILGFSVLLALPTTLAFTETKILTTNQTSYTRTIFQEVHQGRIQFSFTANDSLTVQITDASITQTFWTITATNGSCDLDVNASDLYRAHFSKSTGYGVSVQYTVVESGGIPAFNVLFSIFILMTLVGLVLLKRQGHLFKQ